MRNTTQPPADVRGRIIRASILPIEDEETMIARLRAGAEAVERGELDAEDFAGIWSQYLRELFRRASSVPAPADVRELAVEVIRLNTALALLKTEENAAHVEAVATNAAWLEELERIAAFATRTPAAPALGWSEVRGRANMLRAVLREHGFEHLRSALVGQHSDAVFYGQWERHKALLRDLLDALDVALRSEPPGATSGEGEADAESGGDVTVSQLLAVLDEYNAGVFCMTPENADGTPMFSVAVARGESAERLKQWASEDAHPTDRSESDE